MTTDERLFMAALNYEAKDEKDAFEFFPKLFALTGSNGLWQLLVLEKMYYPGGEHAREVKFAALHLLDSVPDDVKKIPRVRELCRRFLS